jgi:hypothetical protein
MPATPTDDGLGVALCWLAVGAAGQRGLHQRALMQYFPTGDAAQKHTVSP